MKGSIIIPVYNRPELLEETLNSINGLTDAEIIVIDDGSSKINAAHQKRLCEAIGALYFGRENKGISESRNEGLLKAKGDYILFLDSDDLIQSDFIGYMNSLNTSVNILRTDSISGTETEMKKMKLHPLSFKRMTKFDYLNGSQISTFVFNRTGLLESDIRFKKAYSEDNIFLSDLLDKLHYSKGAVTQKASIKYRVFSENSETKDFSNLSGKGISYLEQSKNTKYHLTLRFVIMTSNILRDIKKHNLAFNSDQREFMNHKYNETLGGKTFGALPAVFKFRGIKRKLIQRGFIEDKHE